MYTLIFLGFKRLNRLEPVFDSKLTKIHLVNFTVYLERDI